MAVLHDNRQLKKRRSKVCDFDANTPAVGMDSIGDYYIPEGLYSALYYPASGGKPYNTHCVVPPKAKRLYNLR